MYDEDEEELSSTNQDECKHSPADEPTGDAENDEDTVFVATTMEPDTDAVAVATTNTTTPSGAIGAGAEDDDSTVYQVLTGVFVAGVAVGAAAASSSCGAAVLCSSSASASAKAKPKAKPKAKTAAKSRSKGTRFVFPGDELYPTMAFMAEHWAEGPTSDDKKEQKQMDRVALRCNHEKLDRTGTNGYKRRFKCMACGTLWSGPLATEGENDDWPSNDD